MGTILLKTALSPNAIPTPSEVEVRELAINPSTRRVYTKTPTGEVGEINPLLPHSERHAEGGDDPITPTAIGAAPFSHQHLAQDIVNLGSASLKNAPASGDAAEGEVVLGEDTRLSNARTPVSHGHAMADVSGLVDALNSKQPAGSYAGSVHGHAIADVNGLSAALEEIRSRLSALEA